MDKIKNVNLPHHVKERLRHQRLQQLLDHIATKVPKPFNDKRESKDTKLRRIILYIKFLSKKKIESKRNCNSPATELNHVNVAPSRRTNLSYCSKKITEKTMKLFTRPEQIYRKAQIVFLKKPQLSEPKVLENSPFINEQNKRSLSCHENVHAEKQNVCGVTSKDIHSYTSENAFNQLNNICAQETIELPDKEMEYIPNGDPVQSTMKDYHPKSQNNYCNHFDKIYTSSSTNNSKSSFAKNELHSSPLSSLENIYNDDIKLEMNSSDCTYISECPRKCYETENFSCASHPFSPEKQNKFEQTLPPISSFSCSLSSCSSAVRAQENEPYNHGSYIMNKSGAKAENYFELAKKQDAVTMSYGDFSPDQNYFTHLHSPGESNRIPSSNEWVSDDTLTDSGSFARSSSFESPTSRSLFHIKDMQYPNMFIQSPARRNSDCDIYPNENFCDIEPFISPKTSQEFTKLHDQKFLKCDAHKLYDTSDVSMGFYKSREVHCTMPIPPVSQNRSLSLFAFKQNQPENRRVLKTLVNHTNEDCYVPQYSYHAESNDSNVDETADNTTSYETLNYEICSDFPTKKEPNEPLLPSEETSYSFKNFRQWSTDEY